MSNDNFLRTLFNPGELITSSDFNALQRQMHMHLYEMMTLCRAPQLGPVNATGIWEPGMADMLLGGDATAFPSDVSFCPFPGAGFVYPGAGARQLIPVAGPLVQYVDATAVGDPNEANPVLLPYWMDGSEFTLTTAVGDATNPRVDLVEMKLQTVDDGSVSRTIQIDGAQASLDLAPLTAVCETVIQARAGGRGGNDFTLALVADGTGAGTLTRNGNAYTFHFQTGVTTVANFETAINADDQIVVKTTDAGGGTLTTPGDVFAAASFTGGTDSKIATQTISKKRRVQATFQIKQGTPAANPAYPAPDAGFVPVAAVLVPATHNAVHSLANLRDMRYPLGGVRVYDVTFTEFNTQFSGTAWTLDRTFCRVLAGGANGTLSAKCPVGGHTGRVIGAGLYGTVKSSAGATIRLVHLSQGSGGAITNTERASLDSFITSDLDTTAGLRVGSDVFLQEHASTDLGTRLASSRVGSPIWVNGQRCGPAAIKGNSTAAINQIDQLALQILGSSAVNTWVGTVRWIVAHGM